jgi:glycosyltransferase involved in cell wall biosynthesis
MSLKGCRPDPSVAIEALGIGEVLQGLGYYSLSLTKALAARHRGVSITVHLPASAEGAFAPLQRPWLTPIFHRLPGGRAGRLLFQHLLLPRILRRTPPDLLHALANLVPGGWRGPAMVTIHDLDFLAHPDQSPPFRRFLFRLLTPRTVCRVSAIVAVSPHTAGTIAEAYPEAAGRVHVVPEGAPEIAAIGSGEIDVVVARHRITPPYFLAVGSIERRKNLPAVIDAFERFLTGGHDASLALVGRPGYGHASIDRRVNASPARHRIVRPGYVPAEDLPPLLAGAEALLFLSESEGFGLPALEAMAQGCPVIAARAGALPDTCGEAALLVDPRDAGQTAGAMALLHADRAFRRDLADKGRLNLERFSWERHADRLVELWLTATAKG